MMDGRDKAELMTLQRLSNQGDLTNRAHRLRLTELKEQALGAGISWDPGADFMKALTVYIGHLVDENLKAKLEGIQSEQLDELQRKVKWLTDNHYSAGPGQEG